MEKLRLKQDRKKENKKKEAPLVAVISKVLPLAVGDNVVIKGQTSVGTLTNINNGKNAVVTFGMMKTQIKLDKLERTQRTIKKEENIKSTFISSQTQDEIYEKRLNFRQDIDVRGMRGDEAIQAVTYFIDDAILVGMSRVRILHGTGTGILRILIRDYLKTISGVKNFQDEHVQLGGIGITVVDLI